MPLAYILSWIVGVSCFSLLIRSLGKGPARNFGWAVKSTAVLIVTLSLEMLFPQIGGLLSLVLWGLFIVIPPLLRSRIQRLLVGVNFEYATVLAHLARFLHPFDDYLEFPRQVRLMRAVANGDRDAWSKLLDECQTPEIPPLYQNIPVLLSALGRWEQAVAWWEQEETRLPASFRTASLSLYLRALGETGRVQEMVITFFDNRYELEALGASYLTALLFIFAFTGREKMVEAISTRPELKLQEPNKRYWYATALSTQGKFDEAHVILTALARQLEGDPKLLSWVKQRQAKPLVIASSVLSQSELQFLDTLQIAPLPTYTPPRAARTQFAPGFQPRVTYCLGAVILFFFCLEIYFGGSESNEGLIDAGGVHTYLVVAQGEWWRFLTAIFVHAGPIHLGMNMLALYFVGPMAEFTLGRLRFLVIYILCGLTSTISVTLLAHLGFIHHELLVGASGAIMGLIGSIGAVAFQRWLRDRSHVAFAQLRQVGFALVIQIAFDLSTPQVSSAAHMSGAIAGFLLTLLLYRPRL